MSGPPRDPWESLGANTCARIAIGRVGASLPTREVLSFALAHARARDAVQAQLRGAELGARMRDLGLSAVEIESRAVDRATYLRRPDLGRQLEPASRRHLENAAPSSACDVALMIGDGLSASAANEHAPALIEELLPHLLRLGLVPGPVALAHGARVALGDEVGAVLGARLVAVVIGERPGLSAADSLGIYLTFAPRPGRTDAERNCISNVRAGGLTPRAAAANAAWLIEAAFKLGATGVGLKDQSGSDFELAAASVARAARLVPAPGPR